MHSLISIGCLLSTFISVHGDGWPALSQQPIQPGNELNEDPFDPSFDDYVEDLLKECHVPGISIAVVDNGRIFSKVTLPHSSMSSHLYIFSLA